MSISKKNILEELSVMEDDEIFYKTYYQAGSTPSGLKKFLSGLDLDDVKKRRLIVPEISPESIPHIMDDQEYFDKNNQQSVFFSKHNRYTPAFCTSMCFLKLFISFLAIVYRQLDLTHTSSMKVTLYLFPLILFTQWKSLTTTALLSTFCCGTVHSMICLRL